MNYRRKNIPTLAGTAIFIIFSVSFAFVKLSAEKKFTYVGVKVCRQCHNETKILYQYRIWLASPHANAVKDLTTASAREIGKKVSISNPVESLVCLKCHTTGGGKNNLTRSEGVGCESCHGPGSEYYEISKHVDFQYRRNGYMKAKKNGMYPILKYESNLKKREKLCLFCHRQERPCWPEKREDIARQKLTIQAIDKLQKGDINFYHSLRKY